MSYNSRRGFSPHVLTAPLHPLLALPVELDYNVWLSQTKSFGLAHIVSIQQPQPGWAPWCRPVVSFLFVFPKVSSCLAVSLTQYFLPYYSFFPHFPIPSLFTRPHYSPLETLCLEVSLSPTLPAHSLGSPAHCHPADGLPVSWQELCFLSHICGFLALLSCFGGTVLLGLHEDEKMDHQQKSQ